MNGATHEAPSSPLTLGIDEAGRGPVLGPMVLAAVALDESQGAELERLGVRDSKVFGASRAGQQLRATLAGAIAELAHHVAIEVIAPAEIDRWVVRGELNALEREAARRLIARCPVPTRIVADGARLFGPLRSDYPQLDARDRADASCIAVAAASIVAKDRRDDLFACIAARYRNELGFVGGGGYPNACTRRFLDSYRHRYGALPPEARLSWKSISRALPALATGTKKCTAPALHDSRDDGPTL